MRRLAPVLAIALLAASAPALAEDAANAEELAARVEALEVKVAELEDALTEVRLITVDGINSLAAILEEPETEASTADQQAPENSSEWRPFAHGWEHRKASILQTVVGPLFVIEVRRTGPSVQIANLSVTLYGENASIVAVGESYVSTMQPGDIKVVRFLLDGDASRGATFRLQLDSEL